MRDHRKLRAYQLADSMVLSIYQSTADFPRSEVFGLISQMRRAAVSVVANIVEKCARESQRDSARFPDMSIGSLREAGYCIDLSRRLKYLRVDAAQPLAALYEKTARVLAGLSGSMRKQT